MKPGQTYSTNEAASITGLSLRQLQWYDEQKVLCPRRDGHARAYSEQEAIDLVAIAELRRKGVSMQRIRRIVVPIRKQTKGSSRWLATDGRKVHFEDSTEALAKRLCDSTEPMYVVDLRAAKILVAESKRRAA